MSSSYLVVQFCRLLPAKGSDVVALGSELAPQFLTERSWLEQAQAAAKAGSAGGAAFEQTLAGWIQAHKRKPGVTVAGKRKGRGRMGKTLQQQSDDNDAEAVDNDAGCDDNDVRQPSGENNKGRGGSNANRPSKTKQSTPTTGKSNEEVWRQRNRERDERRQRWVNNKVTASTNKTRPCNDDNHSATAKPKTTKTNSAEGKLLVKDGDLLQADDDIIIHETNCVSASAKSEKA